MSMKIQLRKSKKSEAVSDGLEGIEIPAGSILEDVVDWAKYEAEDGEITIAEVLKNLTEHGVRSGMTPLIYHEDGVDFFNEHKEEINDLLAEAMDNSGSFPELEGFDKDDPLCLGANNQFCLAAFAFEETAYQLLEAMGT